MNQVADVVVIGGGVAGLSTALQISARRKRVVLFDKGELGSGSTGQASGLLGQLRSTKESTRMLMDSIRILRGLEHDAETRIFTESGSVRVAQTESRVDELETAIGVGEAAGLEIRAIDASDVKQLAPYATTDDILAACWCPTDGYLRPPDLATLYSRLAISKGAQLRANTKVDRVSVSGGAVRGVEAAGNTVWAPVVVNAGGPWSYLLADLAGQRLPTAAIAHCYLKFDPNPGNPIPPLSPSIRDRENRIYSRPTFEGGFQVGIYEAQPVGHDMELLPDSFRMSEMATARDHRTIQDLYLAAGRRFPFIKRDTPAKITTGIMSWTPDGNSLCGRIAGVEGLYHCTGFCGHGVMQSAAIGSLMAEVILDGHCRYDLNEIEADRFSDIDVVDYRSRVKQLCKGAYASCYGSQAHDAHS